MDLDGEVQQNLIIKETNDGQHLKDDATFALNSKNIVTHLEPSEINNLVGLNVILQGMPIGLRDQSRLQIKPIHHTNFEECSSR